MKSLLSVIIVISTILFLSACVYINNPDRMPHHRDHKSSKQKYFSKIDKSKDGFISKKENSAYAANKFKKMDLNKDNKLSLAEFLKYKKLRSGKK